MKQRIRVYLLQDLVDEDSIPNARVFGSPQLAADALVSMIDDQGLTDEEGEDLDMDVVAAWDGKEEFEAWDPEGRVLFRLYAVTVDE